jgi:hypothetical protein
MSPPIAWRGPEELETVQRHGIKLLICIINDGGYGAEMHKFRAYGVDPMHAPHRRGGIAQVARGFGLNGRDTRLLAAKNSRNRIPARSPAQQPAPVASPRQPGPAGSWVPRLVAALIIRKAPAHRRFGRKTLGADFVEVVAALGTGVSVILPSLMIGIDQRIVAERRKTFGEAINGVLLYGSEHFGVPIIFG